MLTALGRSPGIPAEWVVELTADGYRFAGESVTAVREEKGGLKEAILGVLPDGPPGLSRKAIWDRLPGEWRKNEVRFKQAVEAGVGELWFKGGGSGPVPASYWRDGDEG